MHLSVFISCKLFQIELRKSFVNVSVNSNSLKEFRETPPFNFEKPFNINIIKLMKASDS